ncbi:carboxyltransferase domain-containing protein [Pseudomonas sp. NPDC012596]|uniref:carboxyltransferase domain-containing protein n=1 Tax=Pseudomonas sp. NPDC012596 TaxID=3364419 RepID=UPI0036BC60C4
MNASPLPTPQICFPGGNYLHFDVTAKNFNLPAQDQLTRIKRKVLKTIKGIEDINLGLNHMTILYNPYRISPISLANDLRKLWFAT